MGEASKRREKAQGYVELLGRLGLIGETVAPSRRGTQVAPNDPPFDVSYVPDPARGAERAALGLLGRMAATPARFETFHALPSIDEVLTCLENHLAPPEKRDEGRTEPPFLWIVSGERPASILEGLAFSPWRGWPRGVYEGPALLRVGLVVVAELPRTRSTLLVRLMGAGPTLAGAIDELKALPPGTTERVVGVPPLIRFRAELEKAPERTREEEAFLAWTQDLVHGS